MGILDINQAKVGDMDSTITEASVNRRDTDGVDEGKETVWSNDEWSKWWGYFNEPGDIQSALIMKSVWNVGKGWTADRTTTIILDNITGWGKDSFDDILFNQDLVRNIGGDSYAEIIRNDSGTLINLRPLDPSSMRTILNSQGIIIRYEQVSKRSKGAFNFVKKIIKKTPVIKFKPQEIFHLTRNRVADQIHGISDIQALEEDIKADKESFQDGKKLMHRQARPFILWKLKTDDDVKIAAFIAKVEKARENSDDLYIPDDENLVSYEVVTVNVGDAIFKWRTDTRNSFYRRLGLPLIIFGSSGSTESGGKMEVFAHEQVFSIDQRYIETQIWNQLALRIKLVPPATLLENIKSDEAKDANQGLEFQPQDAKPGVG